MVRAPKLPAPRHRKDFTPWSNLHVPRKLVLPRRRRVAHRLVGDRFDARVREREERVRGGVVERVRGGAPDVGAGGGDGTGDVEPRAGRGEAHGGPFEAPGGGVAEVAVLDGDEDGEATRGVDAVGAVGEGGDEVDFHGGVGLRGCLEGEEGYKEEEEG